MATNGTKLPKLTFSRTRVTTAFGEGLEASWSKIANNKFSSKYQSMVAGV